MKIVIIDDDEDLCALTRKVLVKYGHEAFAFSDALQGIAHSQNNRPDLILMDVMMPQLSGPEIVQQLKQDAQLKSVPVVFLTGLVTGHEKNLQEEGISVSGIAYPTLGKPYEIASLLGAVQRYGNKEAG